jgi:cellulose synthase/poly-beta-1,6-N-acetylglucosamine synthase-like glycosyltransferase
MKQGTATIIEAVPAELIAAGELHAVGNVVLSGNDRPSRIADSSSQSRLHLTAAGVREIELSVVIPCLNEGLTIGKRVRQALGVLREAGVAGEVIVADNGSTDGSAEIAEAEGARVVRVAEKGYGSALMGGIAERGASMC